MSLTSCIRKAGSALHADDKAAILARATALRKVDGVSTIEAAKRSVEERIAAVQTMLEAPAPEAPAPAQAPAEAPASKQDAKMDEAARITDARETQRELFNSLSTDEAMIGKDIDELMTEIQKRWPTGDPESMRKLAESIRGRIANNRIEIEKRRHQDPAVLAAAIQERMPDGLSVEEAPNFVAGFQHAMAGKNKSTLTGDDLPNRMAGFNAAREWLKTEEGKAWYEGRPVSKLVNTGIDLRRHWELMRAQMKAGESNIEKSWAQIERATARSDLFAPLIPEDAKPGFKLYMANVREGVRPFKEWLNWHRFDGARGRNQAEDLRKLREGDRYPSDGVDVSAFQAQDQVRLDWIARKADEYLNKTREFISTFENTTSVKEAAEAFAAKYMVEGTSKLNKEGMALHSAQRPDVSIWAYARDVLSLAPSSRNTTHLIEKEDTIALPDRATPLSPPKIDLVERSGTDYRKGENITPEAFKKTFGFADVGFGSYVKAKADQDHLNYAHDAFMDLAKHMGASPGDLGFDGKLHFTVGALGHGKFSAHFQAEHPGPDGKVQVINLTNTRGDGTVYHEWVHALDHNLGGEWKAVRSLLVKILTYGDQSAEAVNRRVNQFLFEGTYYPGHRKEDKVWHATRGLQLHPWPGKTAFKRNADKLGEDYWGNSHELIARAAEAWAVDTLKTKNNYLVNPAWAGDGMITQAKGYRGTPYPTGNERAMFAQAYNALARSIKWNDGKPTVSLKDFERALPDNFTSGNERIQELLLGDNMRTYWREETARREQAKQEQERANDITAQPPVVDAPQPSEASGVLTRAELKAIFDEAAAEVREESQEKPEVPAPGVAELSAVEQALGARWDAGGYADREPIAQRVYPNQRAVVHRISGSTWAQLSPGERAQMSDTGLVSTIRMTKNERDAAASGRGEENAFKQSLREQRQATVGGRKFELNHGRRGWEVRAEYRKYNTIIGNDAQLTLDEAINEAWSKEAADARDAGEAGGKPGEAGGKPGEADTGGDAARLIAKAAELGVSGLDDVLKGLSKLFGASKGGRLNSFGGGWDEDTWKEAKPLFESALKKFQESGKTIKQLFKYLIDAWGNGIEPYLLKFAEEKNLKANLGEGDGSEKLAERVRQRIAAGHAFDWRVLFSMADESFGGTQANGVYTVKDAYDAMEAGVNKFILSKPSFNPRESLNNALFANGALGEIMKLLPTQTKRTGETDEFQQFSTVPTLAHAAAWVANITEADTTLEPSAGIGGLAVFAHNAGSKLILNELSSRRAAVLQSVFPAARVFQENAEQLDNVLPEDAIPSVVLMNPPFSSSAGRMQGVRDTMNGARHVEQALNRLAPGGRLVAIVGEGMTLDKPAFKEWWDKIRKEYDVRAVIPIDGREYAKYGTTFDNAMLVIDKRAPNPERTIIRDKATRHIELFKLLEGVRNDRPNAQLTARDDSESQRNDAESQHNQAADGGKAAPAGRGPGDSAPGGVGAGESPGGSGVAGGSARSGRGGAAGRPGSTVREPGNPGDRVGDDARTGGDVGAASGGGSDAAGQRTGVTVQTGDTAAAALTDSIFESYTPQRLTIPGSKPHPGALVQSAALSSVLPPAPTYTPNLPKATITEGMLSLAQLEAVVYTGQAHEQFLDQVVDDESLKMYPELTKGEKYRRGFYIGDGTGVGKGREIAGVIVDNLRQGRKKAVWISEKQPLIEDAKRDFAGVGGKPDLIFAHKDTTANGTIDSKDGVLFTTYHTLRSAAKSATEPGGFEKGDVVSLWSGGQGNKLVKINSKKAVVTIENEHGKEVVKRFQDVLSIGGAKDWQDRVRSAVGPKKRIDQLIEWLGKDFDGVIAFDEAHNANGAVKVGGSRGQNDSSLAGQAVVDLQARLPNARVMYVSATGATEVANLSFATRLGLWGIGTPFPSVYKFIDQMDAGGLATMELVSRDMKQMGVYTARSLSFDGVTYARVEHELTPLQRDIYDRLAEAWQITLQNFNLALEVTGATENGKGKDKHAKANARSVYWGAQQRFFNQVVTSMQMPTVLEHVQRDLDNGDAVVLQLVNTNEAQQKKALAKRREAADEGEADDLEDLDMTPRDQLITMVEKSFPVAQYEDFTDSDGKKHTRMVKKADGTPVENRQALAMREALLEDLRQIKVPDGPLELLLNHFGPKAVAEITGRQERIVRKPNDKGEITAQMEKRGAAANRADADAFMADKKRLLVFSDAGGTGFSFHADNTKKNQRKRRHYLIQPGWRANKAVQGLGRTHRTNEASQPEYKLASTDIPAQKRFLSSIARRLDQLGALSSGQRDAANQGLFSEKDNLESKYATAAVKRVIDDIRSGQIKGLMFNDFLKQMGLEDIVDPQTQKIAEDNYPGTRQFLNRMLSLKLETQNLVFDAFAQRMEEGVEIALRNGTLDSGMQTIKALESKVLRDEVVYTDPRTTATTRYVELELTRATPMYDFPEAAYEAAKKRGDAVWAVNEKSGRVWLVMKSGTSTKASGAVVVRYWMMGTNGGLSREADETKGLKKISIEEARPIWEAENAKRPATYTEKAHMIVGAMLPIWDRLASDGLMKIARTQTADGQRLLGRVVNPADLSAILEKLNVDSSLKSMSATAVFVAIRKGDVGKLTNSWELSSVKVSDEQRIEITTRQYLGNFKRELNTYGVIMERIAWAERYFVPNAEVLEKLLTAHPLVSLDAPDATPGADLSLAERVGMMQAAGAARSGAARSAAPRGHAESVRQFQDGVNGDLKNKVNLTAVAPETQAQREAVTLLRQLFGHEVVYFRTDRSFTNGAIDRSQPGKVFINADADKPLLAVIGHEMLHALLRDDPALYGILAARMESLLRDREVHSDLLGMKRAELGLNALPSGKALEELLGDIAGDNWLNPKFWQAMAKDQPSRFVKVIDSIMRFVGAMIDKLTGKAGFYSEQYLRDVTAARDIMAEAFRQYAAKSKVSQTETSEFKKWFGESKVVDAAGKPLVVYHGTKNEADFSTFNTPAHFGSADQANLIAQALYRFGAPPEAKGTSERLIPAYLSIQNPIAIEDTGVQHDADGYLESLDHVLSYDEREKIRYDENNDLRNEADMMESLIETLEDHGYDGFVYDNAMEGGGKSYTAFRPEQIKSAIGNSGAFSARDPRIQHSLADTIANFDQAAVRNKLSDMLGDAGVKVSLFDKTFATQYAKAERLPAFKRVFNTVQSYLESTSTLANAAADLAPSILPKLRTLKDIKDFGLSEKNKTAIAAPIYEGTLNDQRVYDEDELKGRFGLNDRQVANYQQFRAAVDKSLDQVIAADAVRLLDDVPTELRRLAIDDQAALFPALMALVDERIGKAASEDARKGLEDTRAQIVEKYARVEKLKQEGYAPLMRFGKFFVHVEGDYGGEKETLFFSLYEDKEAANRALRELSADPDFKGAKISQGVMSQEEYKLFQNVPLDSLEMFAQAVGAKESEVYQSFLKLTKNNRSALKRLIHRKGTAGFSEDVPRTLAAFVTSNARLASGAMTLDLARKQAGAIREGDVKDEAIKLIEAVQSPQDNAASVRGLMFMNFIGGSIASAVVNLTQPITMTLPYLSQWGGIVKAGARLMAAGKVAASGITGDPGLAEALKRAERDGVVSPQEIHHLTSEAMATFGNNPYMKRLAFIWAAPFSLAEQFNRRVSFIAAYRTAIAEGLDNPFEFAEKAVLETQGLYNRGNQANLARGPIGAAALTFKQFSIHYLEWLTRMYRSGPDGKRAVIYALALLMVAGGSGGLPFADDIDDLVDTIAQALGYNLPSKKAKREFLEKIFGETGADIAMRGVTALPGIPLDLSLRMGMGNLLPGTGLFLRSNTDKSSELLEIAGPAGGMAKQVMTAGSALLSGESAKAVQALLPSALASVAKAAEMWSTGEYRDTRGRKVLDVDTVDGAMKFLGFQPSDVARESAQIQVARRGVQLAKNVEGDIADQWAHGINDRNAEAVASAQERLAQWNADNPDSRITIESGQIVRRLRELRTSRAERFIKTVPKEMRKEVAGTIQ